MSDDKCKLLADDGGLDGADRKEEESKKKKKAARTFGLLTIVPVQGHLNPTPPTPSPSTTGMQQPKLCAATASGAVAQIAAATAGDGRVPADANNNPTS